MEDKQKICDLLTETLKATRDHEDLIGIKYDAVTEEVLVTWLEGSKAINVAMDSGVEMIRDIMKNLD